AVTPRENSQHQDLHRGLLLLELLDDRLDASGDLLGRKGAHVVGADHNDRHLGLEVLQLLAIGDPPKNVTGLIAANAQVYRLEGPAMLLPSILTFPAVRYRIAQEDHAPLPLAFFDPFEEFLVAVDVAVELLGRGVVLRLLVGEDRREQTQCEDASGSEK